MVRFLRRRGRVLKRNTFSNEVRRKTIRRYIDGANYLGIFEVVLVTQVAEHRVRSSTSLSIGIRFVVGFSNFYTYRDFVVDSLGNFFRVRSAEMIRLMGVTAFSQGSQFVINRPFFCTITRRLRTSTYVVYVNVRSFFTFPTSFLLW